MGGQPAPDRLEIQARVNWWRSDTVRTFGGRYAGLYVAPSDWALNNATITFHIGDNQAEETVTYNGRTIRTEILNLTFP